MKNRWSLWLGLTTLLALGTDALAQGVYFNMVINYDPNPASCQVFINSGALAMAVNPGIPDSMNRDQASAIINPNATVAIFNAHPGYTVLVPMLRENVFCSVACALTPNNENCWSSCQFAVNNFYSVQKPTYAVPNGTIVIRCPTLTMSKFPNYPNYPYTKYPYNR